VFDIFLQLLYAAVKAFSAFSWLALDRHRALTVSLATSGMELTDTLELRPDSPLQKLQLPSLPTKVFVYATGAGCATVQVIITTLVYTDINIAFMLIMLILPLLITEIPNYFQLHKLQRRGTEGTKIVAE
jgi:hypothetical protein